MSSNGGVIHFGLFDDNAADDDDNAAAADDDDNNYPSSMYIHGWAAWRLHIFCDGGDGGIYDANCASSAKEQTEERED